MDQDNTVTSLGDYVGVAGQTHTADEFWLRAGQCNGVLLQYEAAEWPAGYCDAGILPEDIPNMQNNMRRLADVLGQVGAGVAGGTTQASAVNGSNETTRSNHVVGAFTSNELGPDDAIQFQTSPLELPVSGTRFYTASVDVAELSCDYLGGANNSRLAFAFLADGDELPLTDEDIRACTDPSVSYYTSPDLPGGWHSGGGYVAAGRFHSDSSALLSADEMENLQIVMRNRTGHYDGNDAAFDNIRIVDVTPQLDKAFSPTSVPTGGTSTLTLTVTNTSELAAKDGWSFTDALPEGLVIAEEPNVASTCDATVTAPAGGSEVEATQGRLVAGEVSCTVDVDVTSDTPVGDDESPKEYLNDADNFTTLVGLTPPGPATVEFYSTPELEVTKTSDATEDSRPGDTITYTVTATNTGNGDYTEDDPAVVLDDLSGVLDDADYNGDVQATQPGSVSFESPLLGWTGALPIDETVELTYTVTLTGGGDGTVRNVAWVPEDPETPVTPMCDPAEEGVDPETGEPCAENEYLLPKLSVEKTADRAEVHAVGERVEYTITATNEGPGVYTEEAPASFTDDLTDVLDAATFNDGATASTGEVSYDEPTLSWEGALGEHDTATITYTVTYTGEGDRNLRNLVCIPEAETAPGAASCAEAQTPGAGLTAWKQVSSSDEPAVAGSVLTYTLFFANDGEVAATVDHVDDLTHVLDDADVTAEPTTSADDLTVARDGNRIAITGEVPGGETYTVEYEVTVKPDGERGDDIAANFLLSNGPGNPPVTPEEPVCEPEDTERPNCTVTPIAAVEYAKSVAASSDPVEEGTVLTYTVTVTNTGAATTPVSREDVLTDVLDDAELTSAPVSDTDSVTVSDVADGRFQIGGDLAANQTATVTYEVTVKSQSERGNNSADNFLVPAGGEPPAECAEDATECTSTPLPKVDAVKSSDPESGSVVTAGQEVAYTLTFFNSGEGAGTVDYIDDMSGVFDDAALTTGPEASDETLTASLNADDTLQVNGVLEADQMVTVSYTVTVFPDGQRGDNLLGNVLAPRGVDDPECGDDGVSCTEHPVPLLDTWKQVEVDATPVAAGTVLTYTLFFENTGRAPATVDHVDLLDHVTDDADITTEPTTTDDLTVTRDGDRVAITGEVPAGETYEVTYQVTVRPDADRGDDIAANFLLPNSPEAPPVPPEEPVCQPEDAERPDCTVTPIGKLLTGKAVSADSDPIEAGTVLAYTLTFDNQGQGPAAVDHTDVLADVLDDAELTRAPAASNDTLSVSDVTDGAFTVTGELAAGQVATVAYQVTVKDEAARGNNTADNFLIPADEEPPAECAEDDGNCTVTPLPLVDVVKSSDPATGTGLRAGQEVSYTLTFTNTGEASGAVDYTDDLTEVLDDADLTGAPVSSDPALLATDGADGLIRVTGELAPSQLVTVTYTVTVGPDGDRGDNQLRNVVVETGEEPPADCEPGRCIEHPIGELDDWKSVDPASGSTLRPGETVVYTLHFANTGTAPVEVNRDDVLTGVLDDVDVTGQPAASSDALTASEIADGRFTVTGELAPDEEVTVSYEVTVKPDGQRGDDRLDNFLVPLGDNPPEECVPADPERPDCTVNHVSDVAVDKSSDPETGTEVDPGEEITYTVTFTNRSANPEAAPGTVDYTDHMADVLDDATLTAGPTVSNENLTAMLEGETIRITGSVPTGEVYTVTYTVTANDYAEQGNQHLGNVVAVTGEEPICVDGSPLCTEHDVPEPPAPPVPPEEPGEWLSSTGVGVSATVLLVALLLLGVGGGMLLYGRRRTAAVQGASQEASIDDLT
ncbi:DUF7927 domain-containing protein [Microbacterium suaedae]|uniref:DUF7927 domain-containing protein n=1 Tax=Microbacterium suaedae TaxID=2067813 RepID=UPI0013A623E3|nr:DUF11 domain-containing protein [Microbacterium suaedae]